MGHCKVCYFENVKSVSANEIILYFIKWEGINMMDVISSIQGVVWGPIMLVLLFGTHVFLTLRTRVIQRYVFKQ